MLQLGIQLVEKGLVPDFLVRQGVRRLCTKRLVSLVGHSKAEYVEQLKKIPVATATREANEQHYEVPAEFFKLVLGPHLKYSCGFWPSGCESLEEAESRALDITMERAQLADGMNVLELGCGWGSLTLAMAKKFPKSKIVAISNSTSQREFILNEAQARGLSNVQVLTRDLSVTTDLNLPWLADRIVSVEMFEHIRNYQEFLTRVSRWLAPSGKLFVHIFTHRHYAYLFETEADHDWMGRHFFTGGQMPSTDLLKYFQDDFHLLNQWQWDGRHYQKTAEAWLKNMDLNSREIRRIFARTYGRDAEIWVSRWRVFFIAVAELFGYDQGSEWGVTHYLLSKKGQV